MEQVWVFDHLAITVARVDFLDPEIADEPDARERGVRVEVRPVSSATRGTIYSSDDRHLQPAVCRIDLLESAPGAADRMHWHPTMRDGEPGERTFEPAMPPDPVGWLTTFLDGLGEFLAGSETAEVSVTDRDLAAIRTSVSEIGAAVTQGLAWARQPWPVVSHDERGMAQPA